MTPRHVIRGSFGGHRICHAPAGALELGRGVLAGQGLSGPLLVGMTKEALAGLSSAALGVETGTWAEHGWWIGTVRQSIGSCFSMGSQRSGPLPVKNLRHIRNAFRVAGSSLH